MKTLSLGFILLMLASSSALAQNPLLRTEVTDHFKTVIVQTPYKVELCANKQVSGGTQRMCRYETRYKEESTRVYSYSIVTFWHQGQQYQVKFLKNTPLG